VVAAFIGAVLAFVVGDVLRVRRAHVVASMQRAGLGDAGRLARSMYRSLGRGLCELVFVGVAGPRALRAVHVPEPVLSRLREGGRGCVVATAHTGNWDLVACAVAARAPLTVVTKHFKVGFLDALWQGARRARGVRLVAAGGAARVVSRALARGELVAMLVDQAPERSRAVVEAPFLGATAVVDLSPALTALRAGVPLAAVFPVRLPDGTHTVTVAAVFEPPSLAERASGARPTGQWAADVMREVTALLDAHVRAHPAQWLWMHRRWKGATISPKAVVPAALAGAGG
jgi:KDO2-lipid IV(A) lauroyltransferase